MQVIKNENGTYAVEFLTQTGSTGHVDLPTSDLFEANRLAAAMRVKDLETVSGIIDLTHQAVTQIIAGRSINVLEAIELWHNHVKASKILSPITAHVSYHSLLRWARTMDCGALPISAITPTIVSEYVNAGSERRSTALRKLTAIRQLFSFCLDSGYCVRNPSGESLVRVTYDAFTHVEKEHIEKRTFTDEEIGKLLAIADPFWRAAITIAVHTGLRFGDIASLDWSSFTDTGRIVVWTDKSNKRIDLPVHPDIYAVIEGSSTGGCSGHTTGYVSYASPTSGQRFVFPHHAKLIQTPSGRAALSMQFRRMCKGLGILDKSFHNLRHTYATNRTNSGQSLLDLARDLGHSSVTTTQNYVHGGTPAT